MDQNRTASPEAMRALMDFKMEIAEEVGNNSFKDAYKTDNSLRMSIYNEGKNKRNQGHNQEQNKGEDKKDYEDIYHSIH